jgi:hypothetical protein
LLSLQIQKTERSGINDSLNDRDPTSGMLHKRNTLSIRPKGSIEHDPYLNNTKNEYGIKSQSLHQSNLI